VQVFIVERSAEESYSVLQEESMKQRTVYWFSHKIGRRLGMGASTGY
jgi:hypothetical protein